MVFEVRSTLIIAILFAVSGSNVASSNNCNTTRRLAYSIFGNSDAVHNTSIADTSLKTCFSNSTCCSKNLEMKLAVVSEEIRVQMVSRLQGNIKEIFGNTSKNYTGFFKSLIETSYKNLDILYSRTYLDRYTNHKAIFRDLFTKLGDYMSGKEDIDLKQTIESWFSLLYQKVYMIAKPGVKFDATYQHCILETADTLAPFGDLPRRISLQIKKSFLASKVLQDAIGVGKKVIDELLKMKAQEKCSQAFTKMTQCSICSGVEQSVKPCFNYCMNVIKGCSAYPAVVNPTWNAYITALQKLAIKANGPFSMEAIIEPLGVKISDGIMKFQHNRDNISTHVVNKCGHPPMIKFLKKRSLSDDLSYPYKFESANVPRPTTAYGTSLFRLISQLKKTLSEAKDHWISLPRIVCAGGMAASEGSSEKCWNGENLNGYTKPVVKDGIEDMFNNPEVALNKNQPHLTVPRQVIKLKEITQRILSAASGADSNRIDLEETSGEGSGSGVGSGSGEESGSGTPAPVTDSPVVFPPTTEMDNNVETRPTPRHYIRTTMGNFIPQDEDKFNQNGGQGNGAEEDRRPKIKIDKSVSDRQNSARSLTGSYLMCMLILTVCLPLFVSM